MTLFLRLLPYLLGATLAGAAGWKLGSDHWHGEYQDLRVEFSDYKTQRAETQLTSFTDELKAQREKDTKREAELQAKVAAAQNRANAFQKRLQEAESVDPKLADCLLLPVPDSLREAPQARTAAESDPSF